MVDHGARNLVFTSRSGDGHPRSKELLESLAKRGAKVKAFACDISDRSAFKEVLREVDATFPPIRGVLTCAMQLQVRCHLQSTQTEPHVADNYRTRPLRT